MASYGSPHAHPATPPKDSDRNIDIKLSGLPGTTRSAAAAVFCPEVRRSTFDSNSSINHLDVISCWKGLTLDQAGEIITWERLLGEVLERQIFYTLCEPSVAWPGVDCDAEKITCHVKIDLSKLVHDMISLYFERNPSWQRVRTWFQSGRDLPTMVYNFVRTYDCFLEGSPHPCVQVDLIYSPLMIVGEIIWQPPFIDFGSVPSILPAGALYSLQPEYHLPDLGNAYVPRFASFFEDFEFKVGSQCLPLEWSHAERRFKCIVPEVHVVPTPVETIFTIKSTLYFPLGVRHERTSRHSIKLCVSPSWASKKRTARPAPQVDANPDTMVEESAKENLVHVGFVAEQHNRLPEKRKAEKQVPVSSIFDGSVYARARLALDKLDDDTTELTTKRQRVRHSDSDTMDSTPDGERSNESKIGDWWDKHIEATLSTSCIGEAQSSPPMSTYRSPRSPRTNNEQSILRSRAYNTTSGASRVMPALRKKGSVKRMLFNRSLLARTAPTEEASPPSNEEPHFPSPSSVSGGDVTMTEDSGTGTERQVAFDQDVIQKNYVEFMREKRGGVKVGDADEEERAYESIFLEDGEDEDGDGGLGGEDEEEDERDSWG